MLPKTYVTVKNQFKRILDLDIDVYYHDYRHDYEDDD